MIPIDATGLGIANGVLCCVVRAVRAIRQGQELDHFQTGVVFLAGFGTVGGVHLVVAAFRGDPAALPSSWREYIAVTGVVGLGLSLNALIRTFRRPPSVVAVTQSDVDSTGRKQPAPPL
jgi:hypothetical protein